MPIPSGKVIDRDVVLIRTVVRGLVADGTVTETRIEPRLLG